jgi:hypothetical protein
VKQAFLADIGTAAVEQFAEKFIYATKSEPQALKRDWF